MEKKVSSDIKSVKIEEVNSVIQRIRKIRENEIYLNQLFPSNDIKYIYSYPFYIQFDPKSSKINVFVSDSKIRDSFKKRNTILDSNPISKEME